MDLETVILALSAWLAVGVVVILPLAHLLGRDDDEPPGGTA